MRPFVPELMGAAEVAETLGVKVSNLQHLPHLPEPIQKLRCGSIYLAGEIKNFAHQRQAAQRPNVGNGQVAA